MLCTACYGMLRGQDGRQWRGTYDLFFDHHTARWELERSAEIGCCICRTVWRQVKKYEHVDDSLRKRTKDPKTQERFISAFLSEISEKAYRLDFKLSDSRRLGTFLLRQTGNQSASRIYTPISTNTASDEALELAKHWLTSCTSHEHKFCPSVDFHVKEQFYPTRLIDLRAADEDDKRRVVEEDEKRKQDPDYMTERSIQWRDRNYDPNYPDYVRLIETKSLQRSANRGDNGLYVTLSHCWGGVISTRLLNNTLVGFQDRIELNELPRTFREAIHLARRLDSRIRYIWIDSLCIMQDSEEDWNSEAATMFHVYKNSYCNISATAARNSNEGLYFSRSPHDLWEDEINLNTDGIPRPIIKSSSVHMLGHQPLMRRCEVLDLSFWENEVDQAPVNTRGWVLQERMLPPRVLHFCKHQIAWECPHLEASERFPHGVPSMELHADIVDKQSTLKNLLPNHQATRPIGMIMSEVSDEAHEKWKHIVEKYSKAKLTKEKDKLIAIAGIAEMMGRQIRGKYVAGMWERYLASQILWRVEPVFENDMFSYPSSRPGRYRAPSWSWAAVDVPHGIRCGDTVREDHLHIEILKVERVPKKSAPSLWNGEGNYFGEVEEGCYIELMGVMKRIQIEKRAAGPKTWTKEGKRRGTRYVWFEDPEEESDSKVNGEQPMKQKEHDIVYLDSPMQDWDIIANPTTQLYCVPARTDSNDRLICLILIWDEEKSNGRTDELSCFRRIGLTMIPPYEGNHEDILCDPLPQGTKENGVRCQKCAKDTAQCPKCGRDEKKPEAKKLEKTRTMKKILIF